jgi:glycosyltransferase involved in cell wall biosynthesis
MIHLQPIGRRAPGARPAVCVALPVRDGRAYFAEAIESILAQAGVDLTVRVLDNGSRDGSLDLARTYAAADPRVIVEANPFDLTYYGSLNRALAETDAEYFVPFAADDVMYPNNLVRKVAALEETGAALASSTADQIAQDGTPLGTVWPDHAATPRLTPAPDFFRRLMPENGISCQSVVVRTEALRAVGGFDARSYYAADWLAWLRLSLRHAFATLPEALLANRVHTATITQTGSAAGLNGRDVPATLDHAFGDDRVPERWRQLRDPMVSGSNMLVARSLHAGGIRRVAQGWAAYMAVVRALARTPDDAAIRDELRQLMLATGLHPLAFPGEVVARAPLTAEGAAGLAAGLEELGPLVGRVLLQVDADAADAAMALLAPVFEDGALAGLDVALTPGVTDAQMLQPGRLALTPWGSDLIAVAEAAGVAAYPYDVPDPFSTPPDLARWQTIDLERCLV